MSRKCNHPFVDGFTPDACRCAEINNGIVICKLGNYLWKLKNNKIGWHCDWEKPQK